MFRRMFIGVSFVVVGASLFGASYLGQPVHKSNFPYYVHTECDKILTKKNVSLVGYPYSIKQMYDDYQAVVTAQLNEACVYKGSFYANSVDITKFAEIEMEKFTTVVNSLILPATIDSAVNDAVCDLLHKNGLVKHDVFAKAETEYNSRYQNVKNKLSKLISEKYCGYITKQDVEDAVKNEFTVLVARMKREKANTAQQTESGSGILGWMFGSNSGSTNTNCSSCAEYKPTIVENGCTFDKIYKYQLDTQVVLIANEILQEQGYHQDTLPSRVVSDYSDAIQNIILVAKSEMNNGGCEFLTKARVKEIARIYVHPIIEKIKFKGETCSICLCDYTSRQELGFLPCGHFFHKDCIKQSLDKFGKKCPLCGAYAVKSDIKTEYVPWQ